MTRTPPPPHANGASVAAFLAASLGLLTLGIAAFTSEMSSRFRDAVFEVGKAWIPNAEFIGPYSGKETLALVGWLGSWLLLHRVLRRRDLEVRRWLVVALVLLLVATLLVWPPVWHFFQAS